MGNRVFENLPCILRNQYTRAQTYPELAYPELNTCSANTGEDPKLSPLTAFQALCKQEIKAEEDL